MKYLTLAVLTIGCYYDVGAIPRPLPGTNDALPDSSSPHTDGGQNVGDVELRADKIAADTSPAIDTAPTTEVGSATDTLPAEAGPEVIGPCTVFPQAGCSAGQRCVFSLSTCNTTICTTAGPAVDGEECRASTGTLVCAPGLFCWSGACARFCRDDSDCVTGWSCRGTISCWHYCTRG